MRDCSGLHKFLTIKIQKVGSNTVKTLYRPACLSGWSERVTPDAPPRSPYPVGCWRAPYGLGSVPGRSGGLGDQPLSRYGALHLDTGRYTVTARIAWAYARVLGLSEADATRTIKLTVKDGDDCRGCRGEAKGSDRVDQPAAHEPTSASSGQVAGPVPDLRSLPAWGIEVLDGRYLAFSATVWNAGPGRLVVDGFRDARNADLMRAYQYFFTASGQQQGYAPVGTMEWDARDGHEHWHFTDFATYRLLDARKRFVVRSGKEAFCLANTDVVDYLVPGANWRPTGTDLASACGARGSLGVREVLASGSGDTYAQYRPASPSTCGPGQRHLLHRGDRQPDGPARGSLDHANNVALRKVFITGQPGNRKVRVPQVGIIEEPNYFD